MIVTLTTDFGADSPYVAAMKGVLLCINPEVSIVDLNHHIPPQNVAQASFFLASCLPFFPGGSLHVIVVDPGVGTDRALLHIQAGEVQLLAPDNGCWTQAVHILRTPPVVRRLTESRFWRAQVSVTFQGRDILAPVAGYLSLGIDPAALGPKLEQWNRHDLPAPELTADTLTGEVLFVDRFGNLCTNIPAEAFTALARQGVEFIVGDPVEPAIVRTYGEAKRGALVALISSAGLLEIAVNHGSAAQELDKGVGTRVVVRRKPTPG